MVQSRLKLQSHLHGQLRIASRAEIPDPKAEAVALRNLLDEGKVPHPGHPGHGTPLHTVQSSLNLASTPGMAITAGRRPPKHELCVERSADFRSAKTKLPQNFLALHPS